jgi:hypothetical protein
LDHLYSERRVTGTSIRPYLAAINTVHTRTGFPSPTKDLSSLSFERDTNELPLTAWRLGLAPWPDPRHLVLLRFRSRYVLGACLQLPLLRRDSTSLPVPCKFMVFSPKTLPRPHMRSSSAYAVRKAMQACDMIAFSASLASMLLTPLLCCSHDPLEDARATYCSRSPLPGSTAPSFASIRPPFVPLPWVSLLVNLHGVAASLHVPLSEFLPQDHGLEWPLLEPSAHSTLPGC